MSINYLCLKNAPRIVEFCNGWLWFYDLNFFQRINIVFVYHSSLSVENVLLKLSIRRTYFVREVYKFGPIFKHLFYIIYLFLKMFHHLLITNSYLTFWKAQKIRGSETLPLQQNNVDSMFYFNKLTKLKRKFERGDLLSVPLAILVWFVGRRCRMVMGSSKWRWGEKMGGTVVVQERGKEREFGGILIFLYD